MVRKVVTLEREAVVSGTLRVPSAHLDSQRHRNKDREDLRVENAGVQSNVEDDQFNEALARCDVQK